MGEVLEKSDFENTIANSTRRGCSSRSCSGSATRRRISTAVDNVAMGTVFEEVSRKFGEALNENPGEHFTRRDVVHLLVDLLVAGDRRRLRTKGVVRRGYEPCRRWPFSASTRSFCPRRGLETIEVPIESSFPTLPISGR